jgi:hypothetical protein
LERRLIATLIFQVAFHTVDFGLGLYYILERDIVGLGDAVVFIVNARDRDRDVESVETLCHLLCPRVKEASIVKSDVPVLVLLMKQDHAVRRLHRECYEMTPLLMNCCVARDEC